MSLVDISGQTFARWTVLSRTNNDKSSDAHWLCRCECGKESAVQGKSLRRGDSKSCGCLRRELTLKRIGVNSPGWRGGKTKSSTGYILVQMPSHPAAQADGYVPEHRVADLVAWAEEILAIYKPAKIPLPLSRHIGATFRP